jgi:hypothetical protein
MAKSRREESEWRSKRQRKSVSREGGDAFKASSTRGRIKKEKLLRQDDGNEKKVNVSGNSPRSKQQD